MFCALWRKLQYLRLVEDKLPQPRTGFLVLQGKVDNRFEIALKVAGVVALALEVHGAHLFAAAQYAHAVSELHLVVASGRGFLQNIKDRGAQHIAAHDRVVGEPLIDGGLFVHITDAVDALTQLLLELDGGILADLLGGELAHGDGAAVVFLRRIHQLLEHRRFAEHDIVAQQNAEGFVPDEALGAPDRMAEALGLLLPQEVDVRHVRHLAHGAGFVPLAVRDQPRLQIGGVVKIVLNGGLAAVGDDQDLLDAGGDGLLHNVLEYGLVHQRQHLLRDALGVGQQTSAETRRGNDCFANLHGKLLSFGSAD